jgi:hypothetical protein
VKGREDATKPGRRRALAREKESKRNRTSIRDCQKEIKRETEK